MKLIIKQYLAGLKERGELDVLLPELLSVMGLNVFLKPGLGNRQYGVDVAAYGHIGKKDPDKVYLFSIKSGDLTRSSWNGGNPQDLRESIKEILDVFISTHIPMEYKDKPIEICLCLGGDVREEVRLLVTQFCAKESQPGKLEFSEWNGDFLAGLIEKHFLKEELLPSQYREDLRKAIAILEEPDISFNYMKNLIFHLTKKEENDKKQLRSMQQLLISLWILLSWTRSANNLESALLASEHALLASWNIIKASPSNKTTTNKLVSIWIHIQNLYLLTLSEFAHKISSTATIANALSYQVQSQCSADINLKLFTCLGRLSLFGIWLYWEQNQIEENHEDYEQVLSALENNLRLLVQNNRALRYPISETQIVDINLFILFLTLRGNNQLIASWLDTMVLFIVQSFHRKRYFPVCERNYDDLVNHLHGTPLDVTEYMKASVLLPYLSVYCAQYQLLPSYEQLRELKRTTLSHCTFQLYFLNKDSEEVFYCPASRGSSVKMTGSTWMGLTLEKSMEEFLQEVKEESEKSDQLYEMSAMKEGFWPLILTGCRHHRIPVPLLFFLGSLFQKQSAVK